MEKTRRVIIYCMALLLLTSIGVAMFYPSLPDRIPTHWNAYGNIDRYGARYMIFLPLFMGFVTNVLLYVVPQITPKGKNVLLSGSAYPAVILMVNLLMLVLTFLTIATSLGNDVDVSFVVPNAVGVLMVVIGNYMPKIKPNYVFGIRLPWTLADERVWIKTHRAGGWGFLIIGLAFIICSFLPAPFNFAIPLGTLFLIMLALTVYSAILYNKVNAE